MFLWIQLSKYYDYVCRNTCLIYCSYCSVIQEVSPHVIITSAKQEYCMTRFLQQLGEHWDIII